MRHGLTRREALASLVAAPSLLALCRDSAVGAPIPPGGLGPLAEELRSCTRQQALDVAGRAIRGGASLQAMLAAIFQAGVYDVRPRHVGGKLHAVMIVESIFRLARATDRRSAWLLALWNLDDFKRSQDIDRQEGDWVLPPRPSASFASETAARREFLAAMEAWDDERADRALVGLLPSHDLGSMFEILWPLAARSYVNIGHKMIYAAQTRRVLERLGWEAAEPALRSLVNALLHQPSGREVDDFRHSQEMGQAPPERRRVVDQDPARGRSLLAELRTLDSLAAQKRVSGALAEGVAADTVWDALRAWASELFLRRLKSQPANDRAALLPVHSVTVVNAFGYAWRTTRSEATRRLLILQASGWLPRLRDDLIQIVGLAPPARVIDALGRGVDEKAAADELVQDPTPDVMRVRLRDPLRISTYQAELIGHLARKGLEDHQHKYAAAVFEESALAHASWAPYLLACAVPYLPGKAEAETELARRSLQTIASAGL
jgi:hypothetical protein